MFFRALPYVEAGVPHSVSFDHPGSPNSPSQSSWLFLLVSGCGRLGVASWPALLRGSHSPCRETGPIHPPANAIWSVSNKGRRPPFGLRVKVGVPGSDSCWKGCWFEASDCHPRIGDSVGWLFARRGNRGCSARALGVAPAASLRFSSDRRMVWVCRLTALSF